MLEEDLSKTRAQIKQLEQENAQLKAKLKIVHQRQFKANKTKKVTSDKRPDKKQKKKRGAPKGHPDRKVQRLFKDFFNMTFAPATAMNFDRQATRNGSGIYDDLKEKLRSAASAYCDETFWRQDGVNHYVWYEYPKRSKNKLCYVSKNTSLLSWLACQTS